MESSNIAVDPGTVQYDEWVEKTKSWKVMYPYYFDKTVSRGDGRKVPAALAVEKPDVEDLKQMLQYLGISFMVELNKKHPSDHFCIGRVRYQLTRDDGQLFNPEIKNKYALYKKCGEMIPKLKDRKSATRIDIVNFKPAVAQMPGKPKVMKIKGKRR